jgi:hypothetical protein
MTQRNNPWSTEERAFLIAWADHCIKTGKAYRQTIVPEFQAYVGGTRKVTWNMLASQIRTFPKIHGKHYKFSVKDFEMEGARYIAEKGGQIPQKTTDAMQTFEAKWHREEFFSTTTISNQRGEEKIDSEFTGGDSSVSQIWRLNMLN